MDRCTCTPEQCEACPLSVVCRCLQVTETQVVEAIQSLSLRTVKDVRRHTGAGDGCTCCHNRIRDLLAQHGLAAQAIAS